MINYNVPPTKNSLSSLKTELDLANLGYDLLDQKHNILILELVKIASKAVVCENRVDQLLRTAYKLLKKALVESGRSKLSQIASAVNTRIELSVNYRKIMGVSLPVIETREEKNSPLCYSLLGTSANIDNTLQAFKQVLIVMGEFVEIKVSIVRLSVEIKKTMRRVNALEKIVIPETEEVMKFIESRIEESERNMLILLKTVKKVLHKK